MWVCPFLSLQTSVLVQWLWVTRLTAWVLLTLSHWVSVSLLSVLRLLRLESWLSKLECCECECSESDSQLSLPDWHRDSEEFWDSVWQYASITIEKHHIAQDAPKQKNVKTLKIRAKIFIFTATKLGQRSHFRWENDPPSNCPDKHYDFLLLTLWLAKKRECSTAQRTSNSTCSTSSYTRT